LKGKTLGILGLSFKPDTDDMRFAPSIDIIQTLQKEGVIIQAYDPQAMPKAKAIMPDVKYKETPYEAVRGADALVLLTEWSEFSNLDFKRVKKLLRQPVIFDGRNLYNAKDLKKLGFRYYGMGRKGKN
jgi:UDPglucose 6-dehydrogenase